MNTNRGPVQGASIGNEAVLAKTGKGWSEWFALFDAAGAVAMSHKEIVAIARENGVGSWWQQMVTVEYERARGLRAMNQSCAGDHQVNISKTFNAPANAVFDAWNIPAQREMWLPGAQLTIRKSTAPKSLRITWADGENVDVGIYAKGESKCQCSAEHKKLSSSEAVERCRAHWSAALDRLKQYVEA